MVLTSAAEAAITTDSAVLPTRAAAVDLALDQRHRADHRVEEGLELLDEAAVLGAPSRGDGVVAPRALVGVLPTSVDQLAGLELAQKRIHGVRVDGDDALRDLLDLLDQAVSVRRLARDQVQHEQREDVAAPQLAAEHVRGPALATRLGRRLGRPRRLGDGLADGLGRLARHGATIGGVCVASHTRRPRFALPW